MFHTILFQDIYLSILGISVWGIQLLYTRHCTSKQTQLSDKDLQKIYKKKKKIRKLVMTEATNSLKTDFSQPTPIITIGNWINNRQTGWLTDSITECQTVICLFWHSKVKLIEKLWRKTVQIKSFQQPKWLCGLMLLQIALNFKNRTRFCLSISL